MIGAIGGSLGLFLGFSFFDGICKCMDKLTHLIKYWSGRELEFIEPGRGIRKVSITIRVVEFSNGVYKIRKIFA